MGRFRDLIESIENILQSSGLDIPAWVIPVVLVAIAASIFPMFAQANNSSRARGILGRARMAEGQARKDMEQEALEMVRDDPIGLAVVVSASIQYGRIQLAEEALDLLRKSGKRPSDVKRLEALLYGPAPVSPEAESIAIQNFLDNGLKERVRERLKRALQSFPTDAELLEIERTLETSVATRSPEMAEEDA